MVIRVRDGSEDLKRYKVTLARLSRNVRINQTRPGLCWQEVKDVIDDITNHRWVGVVFLAMNSIDISEEAKVLTVITTDFVERLYEDAIKLRGHQAKGRM